MTSTYGIEIGGDVRFWQILLQKSVEIFVER